MISDTDVPLPDLLLGFYLVLAPAVKLHHYTYHQDNLCIGYG